MRKIAVIALCAALLSGCATENFGREHSVTRAEQAALTCDQIDIEIEKVDEFLTDTQTQWDSTKGRRFLAFLSDLGIGNRRERDDALYSGDSRRSQLLQLRAIKKCPGTAEPRPETD